MTLVHEAFPGAFDPNLYAVLKRYGAFHKARRQVEAKQKEELAKKEAEARAKVLKVRCSFFLPSPLLTFAFDSLDASG